MLNSSFRCFRFLLILSGFVLLFGRCKSPAPPQSLAILAKSNLSTTFVASIGPQAVTVTNISTQFPYEGHREDPLVGVGTMLWDHRYLVQTADGGGLTLLDTSTGDTLALQPEAGKTGTGTLLTGGKVGSTFIGVNKKGHIFVWDTTGASLPGWDLPKVPTVIVIDQEVGQLFYSSGESLWSTHLSSQATSLVIGSVSVRSLDVQKDMLLVVGKDGSVQVVDWKRNQATSYTAEGGFTQGHLCADGKLVVAVNKEGVKILDLMGVKQGLGPILGVGNLAKTGVDQVDCTKEGTRMVIGAGADAEVWDLRSFVETGPLLLSPLPMGQTTTHQGVFTSAAFSPDGTKIATAGGSDGNVIVWVWDGTKYASKGPLLLSPLPMGQTTTHKSGASGVAFSPDGTKLVTAGLDSNVIVWTWDGAQYVAKGPLLPSSRPMGQTTTHTDVVLSAVFSRDGMKIVTASTDHNVIVWTWDGTQYAAKGPLLLSPLPMGQTTTHTDAVRTAMFSPDGMKIVTASTDRNAIVWTWDGTQYAAKGPLLLSPLPMGQTTTHQGDITNAVFSPDGTKIVTTGFADQNAIVWTWDGAKYAAKGPLLLSLLPPGQTTTHQNAVLRAMFSPDGTKIVTASADHNAIVWTWDGTQYAARSPLSIFGKDTSHQNWVLSGAFSPDGMKIVTTSTDSNAIIWTWDGTQYAARGPLLLLGKNTSHQNTVRTALFSPDGTKVITAGDDANVIVWILNSQPVHQSTFSF